MEQPGRMNMNHNMSVSIMGSSMDLVILVKGTILGDLEHFREVIFLTIY